MKPPRRLGCFVYAPRGAEKPFGYWPEGLQRRGRWVARHWFWRLYRVVYRGPDSRMDVMTCTRCNSRWLALHPNAERLECPGCGYLEQVPPREHVLNPEP